MNPTLDRQRPSSAKIECISCAAAPHKVCSMTMKRLLALLFFLMTATPVLAQLQTAPPPGPQSAPIAAPSGAGATTSQTLAPLAGTPSSSGPLGAGDAGEGFN